jgi:transcriptional regulator with XRE-family HTH domain
MSIAQNTTYSMIVAQLLENIRNQQSMNQNDFLKKAGMSQSSWSRINRGISHFTLEEMRAACDALEVRMKNVLADADQASVLLPQEEGIHILENLKGSENKPILPTIIAGAALGFLVFRLLRK